MLTAWLPLLTVLVAIVGAFLAMLKFPQERASAVIQQQSTVLSDMRLLNDDLGETADRIRLERDELLKQVVELTQRIRALETEVHELREDLRRAVSPRRIGESLRERKDDDA